MFFDFVYSFGVVMDGKCFGSLVDIFFFFFYVVKNFFIVEGGVICFNLFDDFDYEEIYVDINCKIFYG